jgi:NTE family protein
VIGVALGGGFARGLAHIGVLKVLKEEGIEVGAIAGTSVGAVIGAAFAAGVSPEELAEVAHLVRFRDFARWTLSRFGICSNDRMFGFLKKVLPVKTFEELKVPLAVAATDFVTGAGVVFKSGSLVDAVRASCAYPGMFLPVQVNGRLLVDGMLAHPVPTGPVRELGAERVIAVYLSAHWMNKGAPRHVFDVIGQCFSIAQDKMCALWQREADAVLLPDVAGFAYDGFERAKDLIRAGEEATRAAMPQIRQWLAAPQPAFPARRSAKLHAPAPVSSPSRV